MRDDLRFLVDSAVAINPLRAEAMAGSGFTTIYCGWLSSEECDVEVMMFGRKPR
jgi:hypothetical protein